MFWIAQKRAEKEGGGTIANGELRGEMGNDGEMMMDDQDKE